MDFNHGKCPLCGRFMSWQWTEPCRCILTCSCGVVVDSDDYIDDSSNAPDMGYMQSYNMFYD
jgi:hypothetical protein